MRVTITKDCFDGTHSRVMDTDLDGLSLNQLVFLLMGADVASITITKCFDLKRALDKATRDPEGGHG